MFKNKNYKRTQNPALFANLYNPLVHEKTVLYTIFSTSFLFTASTFDIQ